MENLLCARHCATVHYPMDEVGTLVISLTDKDTETWSCLSKVI